MTVVPTSSLSAYVLLTQDFANLYLAVSDLEVSMGENAWLLVRFMPEYKVREWPKR